MAKVETETLGASENKASSKPENQEPSRVPVYVSSRGIETTSETVDGKTIRFVRGDVNGRPYRVECDRQMLVAPHVAEALSGLIDRQRAKG
jgi:hypothetical protein